MAIIAFEHAINVKNPIKKVLMAMGAGGEMVHCEIIFENHHFDTGSSWNPDGTAIKPYQPRNHYHWLYYQLGNQYEEQMYVYMSQRVNKGYTLAGLITNMMMNLNLSYHDKNFCSELCFDTLKYAGNVSLPNVNGSSVSPHELHRMILTRGFNQVFL